MADRRQSLPGNFAFATLLLTLAGCTGPAGSHGPAGPPGASGASGATGAAGSDGQPGQNGTNGANGTNGMNGANAPTPYAQTFMVAGGADQAANGAALLNTLAAIPNGDPKARYLVQLGAGIFDVAKKTVQTPASVDLVGAGEAATRIIGRLHVPGTGVLEPAGLVRDLTVECDETAIGLVAISVDETASPTLEHVTAIADAAATQVEAFAIFVHGSSLTLSDVTVLASSPKDCVGISAAAGNTSNIVAQDLRVSVVCTPGVSSRCVGILKTAGPMTLENASVSVKGGAATMVDETVAIYIGYDAVVSLTAVDATAEGTAGIGLRASDTTNYTISLQLEQVTLTGAASSLQVAAMLDSAGNPRPGDIAVNLVDSQLNGPITNTNKKATLSCVNSLNGSQPLSASCN